MYEVFVFALIDVGRYRSKGRLHQFELEEKEASFLRRSLYWLLYPFRDVEQLPTRPPAVPREDWQFALRILQ